MRLTNCFNSLRLHGQQEMEYKHQGVLKVSAIKHWTNTPLGFADGTASVGVCVCRCVCAFISACMSVYTWPSPALQDTPATIWVPQFHAWLAVFLLEARLHWHLGNLYYNMKCDITVHLRGETQHRLTGFFFNGNVLKFVAGLQNENKTSCVTVHGPLCLLPLFNHYNHSTC